MTSDSKGIALIDRANCGWKLDIGIMEKLKSCAKERVCFILFLMNESPIRDLVAFGIWKNQISLVDHMSFWRAWALKSVVIPRIELSFKVYNKFVTACHLAKYSMFKML